MSKPTPITSICVTLFGSHGTGKTYLLEYLEKEHYGKFVPCFGDLYGNKLEQSHKRDLISECTRLNGAVIMEGKRFVDNSLFDSIAANSHLPHVKFVVVMAYCTPEASVQRVNQRRVTRGGEANFKYVESREDYECIKRFDNKSRDLYQSNPVAWSSVEFWYIDVTDVTAWEPVRNRLDELLKECNPIQSQVGIVEGLAPQYPQLSYFWRSRQNILSTKGQEYFDLKLSGISQVVVELPEASKQPEVTSPIVDTEVVKSSPIANKVTNVTVPKPRISMNLVPTECPNATRVQMSKVRRGLRNSGLVTWDKLTDDQVKLIVGAFMAQGFDPSVKSSESVGKNCLALATQLIDNTAQESQPCTNVSVNEVQIETSQATGNESPTLNVKETESVESRPVDSAVVNVKFDVKEMKLRSIDTLVKDVEEVAVTDNHLKVISKVVDEVPSLPKPVLDTSKLSQNGKAMCQLLMKALTPSETINPDSAVGIPIHLEEGSTDDDEPKVLEELTPEVADVELPMKQPEEVDPDKVDFAEESDVKVENSSFVFPISPTIKQGFAEFETCQDAYLYTLQDLLNNSPVTKRAGLLFHSYKPYTFSVKTADDYLLCLPGSIYYDPIGIMPRYAVEWMEGDVVAGGYSYRFDARRQRKYPKANGAIDWSIKDTMGRCGDNCLDWVRRNLRVDSTSRNAAVSVWNNDRDLKGYTARKEQGLQKGDTYSRLACPTSMVWTRDDGDKDNKKGLQVYSGFRAMDFTTAIHSDMMRVGEATHWLALTTENRSYVGRMKFDIASIVFESYGASQFVYFNNLLAWWKSDPRCTSIHRIYDEINTLYTMQTRNVAKMQQSSGSLMWGQPMQKSYDWFLERWNDFQVCDYHWRKGQWWQLDDRWTKIAYPHWQDISLAMAITEMTLMESMKPEVIRLYGTNKQVQRSLSYEKEVGQYLPFYFMEKMKGPYHYYIMVYLIQYLISLAKYDLLDQMSTLNSVIRTNLFDVALSDALVSQVGKRPRDAFILARPGMYSNISNHCNVIMERK